MSSWITLLGVFGLGSVVTTIVQWLIHRVDTKKELEFREKREAYLGLLSAYRDVASKNDHESRMDFAYWRLRCSLVAPHRVVKKIESFSVSEPSSDALKVAEQELIDVIRNDLEITG